MSRYLWADFWGQAKFALQDKYPKPEEVPRRECNEVTTTPYEYTQLPPAPTSIRLLHILPGSPLEDIECRLVDADLVAEDDSYEALSYVWGDVSETTPVQVNGSTLCIGKNLRCALLYLRLADRPRIVWADAICINQENLDERNQQVSIMGKIYQSAHQTIVFLGDEVAVENMPENTEMAFNVIKALAKDGVEAAKKDSDHQVARLGKGEAWTRYGDDGSSTQTILGLDWWKRAWTAQEIVLAKRASLVMGPHQIDWDLFSAAIHHGEALKLSSWTSTIFGGIMESCTAPFHEVKAIRDLAVNPSPNLADELLSYLNLTSNRKAIDPRDKIFAVLGFADGRLQGIGIVPDYRSPVEDVYRDATKKLIEVSGNLDVLGLCFPFKTPAVTGLPSWVPDFGPSDYTAQPLMLDAIGRPRTTHASRGSKAAPRWEDAGETLVVQGHTVDNISYLSAVQSLFNKDRLWDYEQEDFERLQAVGLPYESDSLREIGKDLYNDMKVVGGILKKEGAKAWETMVAGVPHLEVYVRWEEFAEELKPTNPDPRDCSPLSILQHTLCTGTLAPGGLKATEDAFRNWRETLSPIKKLMALKVDKRPALFKSLGFVGHIKSTWRSLGEFFPFMTKVTDRRVGASERGYLCLLPKHAQIGDRVAILKGGRVPVVLRPRDDGCFDFIGETYVHGIMGGEALMEEKCVDIKLR
ncbi:heterokaryon incompatibility protein 6, OR allele [Cladorrhinum sp. PSN332]|nr:heterokaryon incompatibility protein 6, OR allele [Cladorrhinum sp. PSN332]